MSEQAPALATGGLAELASFLDQPEEQESQEELEAETVDESTSQADNEEPTDSDSEEDESEQPEEVEEPAPAEKITIKVKGEDGKEETLELTSEEVQASYFRQKDYTQKTQALAERENEAVKFLTQKHEEIRSQYLSQAELTRAAIVNMAGIKSESEMAELANTDPAAWVAENQRQRQIGAYLSSLDQQIQSEKKAAEEQREQSLQEMRQKQFKETWEVLSKEGIDRAKLAKIYGDVTSKYGVDTQTLEQVYDYKFVQIMRDAVAYRALKEQKPSVMQKAKDAPRMPSKQTPPAQERRDRELDSRFKSGRAKLNDLAAILR